MVKNSNHDFKLQQKQKSHSRAHISKRKKNSVVNIQILVSLRNWQQFNNSGENGQAVCRKRDQKTKEPKNKFHFNGIKFQFQCQCSVATENRCFASGPDFKTQKISFFFSLHFLTSLKDSNHVKKLMSLKTGEGRGRIFEGFSELVI